METLNSIRASHLSFTRSTSRAWHRIALAFVSLIHFVSAADTTAELLYEQHMCGLVVLVASNAIVKQFYFSVVFQ